MDEKESFSCELKVFNTKYNELNEKIERLNKKISLRKSIQSVLGLFGALLIFSSLALLGGIILSLVGLFGQYFDYTLIISFFLIVVWAFFFGISRINGKSLFNNSVIIKELLEQLEETNSKINIVKKLVAKEEQKQKDLEPYNNKMDTPDQLFELEQNSKGYYKFVSRSGEVKWGIAKEISKWKDIEDKLIFEEEQKKKGSVKFVPFRLHVEELMREEGYNTELMSKFHKKRVEPKYIPSEVTWGTPERVFEWNQKEKGYHKFVDDKGKVRWGTEEQIAKWQKERFVKQKNKKNSWIIRQ